jgi:hypothetical protein
MNADLRPNSLDDDQCRCCAQDCGDYRAETQVPRIRGAVNFDQSPATQVGADRSDYYAHEEFSATACPVLYIGPPADEDAGDEWNHDVH